MVAVTHDRVRGRAAGRDPGSVRARAADDGRERVMNTLEIVCATAVTLAAMGELAVARKWIVFSLSVRVTPPAANQKPTAAGAAKPAASDAPLRSAS